MLKLLVAITGLTFAVGVYGVVFVGPDGTHATQAPTVLKPQPRVSVLPSRSDIPTKPPEMALVEAPKARPALSPEPRIVATISRKADEIDLLLGKRLFVQAETVNLRDAPDVTAEVLAVFKRGDAVTFTGEFSDKWYRLSLADGGFGWMHSEYLSKTQPE